MTDLELAQMECERLNKNLDRVEGWMSAYKNVLNQKSDEQGKQLAALTEKLRTQIQCQNSDVELYGKNSFSATLNRQLVNAWVFAIENYGWRVELDFDGDMISHMRLYSDRNYEVLYDTYTVVAKEKLFKVIK